MKGSIFTGSIVKAYFNNYLALAQRTQLWIHSHISSRRSLSKSTHLNPYFLKICFIFEYEYFALYYMYVCYMHVSYLWQQSKEVLESPQLELQVLIATQWMLGAKSRPLPQKQWLLITNPSLRPQNQLFRY